MKSDPVLASKILPASREEGRRHPHTFKVEGGLHYLKGNTAPYFSLTYTEHRQGFPDQEESGGAGHEAILQHFPQFADLAALHLSDIDGAPIHAGSNARYFAGKGQQGKHQRAALQQHLRCADNSVDNLLCLADAGDWAQFDADVEAMRPRWQAEAVTCIIKHGLTLYGEPEAWTGDRPPALRRAGEAKLAEIIIGTDLETQPEPTYTARWGITSTAAEVDRNPNMVDASSDMTHYRVTLCHARRRMTVYYSMGSAHAGREPTAQEVIDCIAQGVPADTFDNWAWSLGYDTDSRAAHRTYTICKRQGERLQKFLGAEHYAELMGEE